MVLETVTVERDGELPGLMTVTLNRPEKLNAINVQMHDDLQQVCRELQDDYETRVVILTGAGRAFSAGADLGSVRAGEPAGTSTGGCGCTSAAARARCWSGWNR